MPRFAGFEHAMVPKKVQIPYKPQKNLRCVKISTDMAPMQHVFVGGRQIRHDAADEISLSFGGPVDLLPCCGCVVGSV